MYVGGTEIKDIQILQLTEENLSNYSECITISASICQHIHSSKNAEYTNKR